MKRKILLLLLFVFIAIQFIPVKLNQSYITPKEDFIEINQPSSEIAQMIRYSCYDCHSNNTLYPWYDRIAPVSWWINHHIEEGKEELNFSEWSTYPKKRKERKLKEFIEMIEEREMPLKSYLITHGDASLSDENIENLKKWIETIK